MKKQDYNAIITISNTAQEAFKSINSVSKWWTEIEGSSQKLNDIFTIHFGKTFITHKIAELVLDKKVVWHVTDSSVEEWKDTKISFEISPKNNSTEINFTHIGIVPGLECYDSCVRGWNKFINESLFELITKGKGVPA